MVHSESLTLGCVCPECGRRCTDCLGTGTLISREELHKLAKDPHFAETFGAAAFNLPPAGDDLPEEDSPGYKLDGAMSGPEGDIYGD